MTADEVKNLLKIHYDIPQMIAEKFATIRHCEKEKNKIALPSVNLSGLPAGKGVPGIHGQHGVGGHFTLPCSS